MNYLFFSFKDGHWLILYTIFILLLNSYPGDRVERVENNMKPQALLSTRTLTGWTLKEKEGLDF